MSHLELLARTDNIFLFIINQRPTGQYFTKNDKYYIQKQR